MALVFNTLETLQNDLISSVDTLVVSGADKYFGFDPTGVTSGISAMKANVSNVTGSYANAFNRINVGGISTVEFSQFMNQYGYTEDTIVTALNEEPEKVFSNYDNFLSVNVSGKAVDFICSALNNPFEDIVGDIEDFFDDLASFDFEQAIGDFIGSISSKIQALATSVVTAIENIASDILERISGLSDLLNNDLDGLSLPERIYLNIKKALGDSINALKDLFSAENLKKIKAAAVNAVKKAVNQFEEMTSDLVDLLSFRLCQTTTELENSFNSKADKIQNQINEIKANHDALKASSELETVTSVEGGRQVPTPESVKSECAVRDNQLRKGVGTTTATVNPAGENTLSGNESVSSPVIIAEKNRAVLAQKSKYWSIEDVTVKVQGTPARLLEHFNYRYNRVVTTQELTQNAIHLMANILDPLAETYGKENIIILSGMRSTSKARSTGNQRSLHTAMQAVDVRFRNLPFDKYDERIRDILNTVPFNRAIAEYVGRYQGPWLHIDLKRESVYGPNDGYVFTYIRRKDGSFVTRNPSSGSGYEPGLQDGSFVYSNPKKSFG